MDRRRRRRRAARRGPTSSTRSPQPARRSRCTASRSRSRTTSTSPGCPRPPARPDVRVRARATRRPRCSGCSTRARSVVGKTNLDQFATGLSGTRSPHYGVRRNPIDAAYIAGGSSSGSAVAVAPGIVPLALGTDTAGSGRVPAACCGIVGLKPTRGVVSTAGVVPASPSFDTVSLFTTIGRGGRASRSACSPAEIAPPSAPRAAGRGSPRARLVRRRRRPRALRPCGGGRARDTTPDLELCQVDLDPLLEAGALLYGSALLAERDASFGEFIRAHPDEVDPAVRELVLAAAATTRRAPSGRRQQLADCARRDAPRVANGRLLLLPTIARHPTIAEALADSIATSRELGTYTTFVNLLDLAAISFPAGHARLGAAVRRHRDRTGAMPTRHSSVSRQAVSANPRPRCPRGRASSSSARTCSGMPLNGQLVDLGARLVEATATSPNYRLYDLGVDPPKPGMIRDPERGAPIAAEVWELDVAALGAFVTGDSVAARTRDGRARRRQYRSRLPLRTTRARRSASRSPDSAAGARFSPRGNVDAGPGVRTCRRTRRPRR